MIPHTKKHTLRQGGAVGESKEYSFEMNAHMASLLSDKLYSNKVEAIIRELACNAQDSHVEAGNPAPIDVHLPSALEPFFYIEDFGIGLSHDDVMTLYTTYGASTKRGTNTQVGQFGLGSKVFFAYTDQATITATHRGKRRTYSAFKDESGMPNITTMGAEERMPVNTPNGVKVYVGVLPGDIEAFCESAQSIFRRFNPRPNVLGHSDYEDSEYERILEGKGWILRKEAETTYYGQGRTTNAPCAVQGNVAYRISSDEMKPHIEGTNLGFMLALPFDIVFEIGELDVASSREELSYNKDTIAAIITRFGSIYDELNKKLIPDLFKACTTEWEAVNTLYTLCEASDNKHYTTLIKGAAKFKGKEVKEHIKAYLFEKNPKYDPSPSYQVRQTTNTFRKKPGLKDVKMISLNEREFSLKSQSWGKEGVKINDVHLEGGKKYLIFWDDETKSRQPSRLQAYMVKKYGEATRNHYYRSSDSKYPRAVIIVQAEKKADFLKVVALMGEHPHLIFNDVVPDIPKVARVAGPKGPRVTPTIAQFTGHDKSYGNEREQLRLQWVDAKVDPTVLKKGYYVLLKKWEVQYAEISSTYHRPNISVLYRMAEQINLVDQHNQVWGVPGSVKNPFENLKGWLRLDVEVASRTLEWFKDPRNCAAIAVQEAMEMDEISSQDRREVDKVKSLLTYAAKHGTIDKDTVAREFQTYVKENKYDPTLLIGYTTVQSKLLQSDTITRLISKEEKKKKSILKALLSHRTAVLTKYPLFKLIDEEQVDSNDAKAICQYIKLMEK